MTSTATASLTTTAPVERLDAYCAAMLTTDAPLDNFISYLRVLSDASLEDLAPDARDRDVARSMALGYMQGTLRAVTAHLISRFDAEVRAAPPSALADVVRDVLVECRNETCDVMLLPWNESCCGFCSDDCEREQSRRES